jgi:hypothetical protein
MLLMNCWHRSAFSFFTWSPYPRLIHEALLVAASNYYRALVGRTGELLSGAREPPLVS